MTLTANPSSLNFGQVEAGDTKQLTTEIIPGDGARTALTLYGSPTWDVGNQAMKADPSGSSQVVATLNLGNTPDYVVRKHIKMGSTNEGSILIVGDSATQNMIYIRSVSVSNRINLQERVGGADNVIATSVYPVNSLQEFWFELKLESGVATVSFGATEGALSPDINLTDKTIAPASYANIDVIKDYAPANSGLTYSTEMYVPTISELNKVYELGYEDPNFVNLAETPSPLPTTINSLSFPNGYTGEFDPAIVPRIADLISNNGVVWNAGEQAWEFDGSSWLEFRDSDNYAFGTGDFSIEAGLKFANIAKGLRQGILGQYGNSTNRLQFYRSPQTSTPSLTDDITFLNKSTDTFAHSDQTAYPLTSASYTTYKAQRVSGDLKIYFGAINATDEIINPPRNETADLENIAGNLEVGRYTSDGVTYYYLDGFLKTLKIYKAGVLVFDLGKDTNDEPVNLLGPLEDIITASHTLKIDYLPESELDAGDVTVNHTEQGGSAEDLLIPVTGQGLFAPDNEHCRSLQRRLPTGRSWVGEKQNATLCGISQEFITSQQNARDVADIDNILFGPNLGNWQDTLALIPSGTTEEQEQDVLRKLSEVGSLRPEDIEAQIRAAGFDVYLHENRNPVIDPRVYVSGYSANSFGTAFFGGSFFGGVLTAQLLVNSINEDIDNDKHLTDFLAANTAERWAYTFFIGGPSFLDRADVDSSRKDEFRRLLLELKPLGMWGVLFVDYV